MPTLSPLSESTSRMEGFMTAPSSREVSPTALPNGWSRSSRVESPSITRFRMARRSSAQMANQFRSPEQFSGDPSSRLLRRLIPGAPIAVVPLSFGGSSVTTLSGHRAFTVWSTSLNDAAASAERERAISREHELQLDLLTSTLSPISQPSLPVPVDRGSTHESYIDGTTPMGEVVTHRRGRHRGSVHRGLLGFRVTRRRGRRTGLLSSLQRAAHQLFGRHSVSGRHRSRPALTSSTSRGSIAPSAQSSIEGTS